MLKIDNLLHKNAISCDCASILSLLEISYLYAPFLRKNCNIMVNKQSSFDFFKEKMY